MKKITKQWLKKHNACSEGVEWYLKQNETDAVKILNKLLKIDFEWTNWTITKLFDRKQRIQYAVYAAQQVLCIFEKKYPDDKRPREAINAAIKCIEKNTEKNRSAAWSAAKSVAESAAWSVKSVAESAAWSAAKSVAESAAWSVKSVAESAARSAAKSVAESAARSVESVAESAAWSPESVAVVEKIKLKILKYGIKLLQDNQ